LTQPYFLVFQINVDLLDLLVLSVHLDQLVQQVLQLQLVQLVLQDQLVAVQQDQLVLQVLVVLKV
jgi:hypothetical protein